jgi:DNA modification methylase
MTDSPYYSDDSVTLYHGDALEILPTFTPGSTHLVLTDPPYVIGAVSAGNMSSKSGGWADMMNSAVWFAEWYKMAGRILRHDGSLWTFCNWRSLPVVMNASQRSGLPVTSMMVWDKKWIGPGGLQGLRPSYEMCALISKPGFAIPDRGVKDIWEHQVGSFKPNGHPAEKPVPLFRRIIETCVLPADGVVVDPFAGSGTTGLAARECGRRSILIEAEEKYCDLIARRFAQDTILLG